LASDAAIATVGRALCGLLEEACPRSRFTNAQFDLYQAGNFDAPMDEGISLYLYRVVLNQTRRNLPGRMTPEGKRLPPALPVDVYYLLTPWGKSAEQQHALLGWAMRLLEDTASLPASFLNQYGAEAVFLPTETVDLVHEPLSIQDLNDIWGGSARSPRPSVAYLARLIPIDSRQELAQGAPVQTRIFEMAKGPAA
jgi:hypothetical protein